jgi:hypothetical protein
LCLTKRVPLEVLSLCGLDLLRRRRQVAEFAQPPRRLCAQ